MIKKTLQPTNDLFLQFTEEEIKELNLKQGDKFTATQNEDGSVFLEKWKPVDIDLTEFPEEIKDMLLIKSIEDQIPIDEVINNLLKIYFDEMENKI